MTSLRDYRFIDRKRLDGYMEQISSTTTHDSTLGLNATLSANPQSQRKDKSTLVKKKIMKKFLNSLTI